MNIELFLTEPALAGPGAATGPPGNGAERSGHFLELLHHFIGPLGPQVNEAAAGWIGGNSGAVWLQALLQSLELPTPDPSGEAFGAVPIEPPSTTLQLTDLLKLLAGAAGVAWLHTPQAGADAGATAAPSPVATALQQLAAPPADLWNIDAWERWLANVADAAGTDTAAVLRALVWQASQAGESPPSALADAASSLGDVARGGREAAQQGHVAEAGGARFFHAVGQPAQEIAAADHRLPGFASHPAADHAVSHPPQAYPKDAPAGKEAEALAANFRSFGETPTGAARRNVDAAVQMMQPLPPTLRAPVEATPEVVRPAAPEPIDAVQQIARAVGVTWRGGASEVRLQLHPAALGELHIRLQLTDGNVSIRMLAETARAHNLILAHLPELRAACAAQGLQLDQVAVMVGGDWSGFEQAFGKGEDGLAHNQGHPAREAAARAHEPAAALTGSPNSGVLTHLVDLRA